MSLSLSLSLSNVSTPVEMGLCPRRRPMSAVSTFIPTVLTGLVLCLSSLSSAHARVVKVLANDIGAMEYAGAWTGPVFFDWKPGIDVPNEGGPNSSVCAMGDVSYYTANEGSSVSFRFEGVSVQLVLTSRPDHTPYSVSLDGATSDGDTYSFAPGCGVSWSRSNLSPGSHVLTATAHPLPGRMFLEILSILYDDGSDLPPPPKPTIVSRPPTESSSTSTPSHSSASSTSEIHSTGTQTSTSQSALPSRTLRDSSVFTPTDIVTQSFAAAGSNSVTASSSLTPPGEQSTLGHTIPSSTIIGLSVTASLAVLLGVLLYTVRRRWSIRRRHAVQVYPLLHHVAAAPSSSTVAASEKQQSPVLRRNAHRGSTSAETSGGEMETGTMSMRLAPEDIDRIAARMQDLLNAQRGDGDELPPY